MFVSEETAKARFLAVARSNRNVYKKLGTHLAKGKITPAHGLATQAHPKSGHFTLFEHTGIRLKDEFKIVARLID